MDLEIKNKILQGAQRMYLNYGFKSVTMDDIAKELGISKKTIYQYYSDKNELVEDVVRSFLEWNKNQVCHIADQSKNIIEELFKTFQHMINNMSSVNPAVLYDLKKFHARAWDIYRDFRSDVFLKLITDSMNIGIEQGYFRAEVNVEILARMRFEQIQMAFDQEIFPSSKFNFVEIHTQFMDHFIRGILTDKGIEKYKNYKLKMESSKT